MSFHGMVPDWLAVVALHRLQFRGCLSKLFTLCCGNCISRRVEVEEY